MLGKSGKYFGLRGTALQIAVGALAGLDFTLLGYDQGVTGGLLTLKSFTKIFPSLNGEKAGLTKQQALNVSTLQGITIGSYTLGSFAGAIVCIWLGDILGRRKTIFLGTSIMVIGTILQASSFSIGQLVVGRLITGMGNGLNSATVPSYQSECSKSHRRGQMVMIEGALITFGIMVAYWLDFGFYFLDPSQVAWRFPIAFQLFFCLIILAFVLSLPESPRWLVLKGKEDEAIHVLAALNDMEPDDKLIVDEFEAIKDTVLEASKGSFRDLFTMGELRNFHRLMLAYASQMFQQISGINLITYYIPNVLQNEVGLTPFLAKLIAACNGTEYFLASWVAVFTIEKVGRRKLMLFGSAGMAICMICLAGTDSVGTSKSGIAETFFLFAFNTCFAIGWLGMTWLYPAEIVPLQIRAPANGVSTASNWFWNFVIVMITPVCFSALGWKTYIIFAVINALIIPCVYFFYPETAYRSLEEMDGIFSKCKSIFTIVKIARDEPRRYDKHGNVLISYKESEEGRRRSSTTVTGKEASGKHREDVDSDRYDEKGRRSDV